MTHFEAALIADTEQDHVQAADLYEQALASGDAPLDAYLNLAVLYWNCGDPGVSAGLQLSYEFLDRAFERPEPVLQEALARFPGADEARFWLLYMHHMDTDDEADLDEIRALARSPFAAEVPCFYLFLCSGGVECRDAARRLYARCRATPTAKNRYMGSLIEAAVGLAPSLGNPPVDDVLEP